MTMKIKTIDENEDTSSSILVYKAIILHLKNTGD